MTIVLLAVLSLVVADPRGLRFSHAQQSCTKIYSTIVALPADLVDGQPVVIGDLLIDSVRVPPVQNQLLDNLVLSVCKLNRHGNQDFVKR